MSTSYPIRAQDSVLSGLTSGLINATTAWFAFRAMESVPLSVDLISSTDKTVWSQGVSLAFTLGIVLTLIGARGFARKVAQEQPGLASLVTRPLFPFVTGVALTNALFLFGCFVVLAVLWQRVAGSVSVSPAVAAMLVGMLAWVVAALTDLRTKRALLRPA